MAKTIAELEVVEARLRKSVESAQAKWKRANDLLIKARKAEEAKEEMTLALALETYLPSGWNQRGYDFLNELTWKGEWFRTGLQAGSGHWCETMQNQLKVAVNHTWDDAKLEALEQHILKVIPLIKPGVFKGSLKTLSKGGQVDSSTLKVLSIFEHDLSRYSDWNLGRMEDGEWIVFDSRVIGRSYGRARFIGTLLECLQEIRSGLWYEGGPTREDNDYDD